MKNRIFEKIKKYALKNRQIPEYNRRQVGKSMSILAIFLFFVFLINFAIIIVTDQMQRLIMSMPLLTRVTSQLPARFSM